jgi:iron-sulfur cluster repair protein YtfE (RIC family)
MHERRPKLTALPQVVRDEHKEMVARIELLRTVADSIGSAPPEALREGAGQAYTFLIHQLIPHAQAEEQILYPTVGRLLCVLEATETMSRDHLEVIRLTEELEALRLHLFYAPLSESDEQALRRVLYGLYAIIKLHLAKEEEIYFPILEARLPAEEVDRLVEAMERTVTEAKSSLRMIDPHE